MKSPYWMKLPLICDMCMIKMRNKYATPYPSAWVLWGA
jgi:hypothetical protein